MILILDNLQFHYNVYQILCLFMSQQVHTGDWRNKWNVIFLITYQTIAEINQIYNTLKRIYNSRAPLIDPSSFLTLSLQVWELHTYYACCSIFLIVYQAFNCPLKWMAVQAFGSSETTKWYSSQAISIALRINWIQAIVSPSHLLSSAVYLWSFHDMSC